MEFRTFISSHNYDFIFLSSYSYFQTFYLCSHQRGEQALEGIKEMNNIELSGSHSNFLFWSVFILAPWQAIYDFSSH